MPIPNPNAGKIRLLENFQKIYTVISLKRLFKTNQQSIEVPVRTGDPLYVLEGNGKRDGKDLMCIYKDAGHITLPIVTRVIGETDVDIRDPAAWQQLVEAYTL